MFTQLPESRPPVLDRGHPEISVVPVGQGGLFDLEPVALPPGRDPAVVMARAGWACVRALLDVTSGRRGPAQLSRWATEDVVADLALVARAIRRQGLTPGRPYVQPQPAAAEIVLPWRTDRPGRGGLRVITARAEPWSDRWRCTHLGWIAVPAPDES